MDIGVHVVNIDCLVSLDKGKVGECLLRSIIGNFSGLLSILTNLFWYFSIMLKAIYVSLKNIIETYISGVLV